MFKNVASQLVLVFAWDNAAGVPKTGDAANITGRISKEGVDDAATNDVNPTELSAANHPGLYAFTMTQGETNCDLFGLTPASATADIDFQPVSFYTAQYLQPTVAGRTLDVNAAGEAGLDLDNTSGTWAAAQFASGFMTATKFAANAIDAAALDATAVNEIVDQHWNEAQSDHVVADSMGAIASELAALNNISSANVLTQINAALDAAIPELAGVPAATPSLRNAAMFLYMGVRNKHDTTSVSDEVYNDAGAVIATAVLSDDTITYIKAQYS